jgi:hypothetical protein
MPSADVIGSSRVNHNNPLRDIDWQIFPARDAPSEFGSYGGRCALHPIVKADFGLLTCTIHHGRIHGVTFISSDSAPAIDSHTLLSLMRLYTMLNVSSPHSLSPPHRVFFPSVPTFSDPRPDSDSEDESIPRQRANIGVTPETFKAAYPSLARAQFAEDFADFASIGLPVLLDRVLIADRGAARHGGLPRDTPMWTVPFTRLRVSENWFEPMRKSLSECILGEDENSAGTGTDDIYSKAMCVHIGWAVKIATDQPL